MTNLPIMTSSPQPAAVSKQTATNATDNSDTQNSQPFGEVLARQIGTPAAKDARKDSKVDDKLAIDLLAQGITDTANLKTDAIEGKDIKIGKDDKKDAADNTQDATDAKNGAAATDATAALPADMLAAIMPHAANIASSATGANAKSDNSAGTGKPALDSRGITSMRANTGSAIPTETTAMPQATAGTSPAPQTGEQSFAAALIASSRLSTGMESAIAAREQDVSAIAQQSNAAALASMQNGAANLAAPSMPIQMKIDTPVSQSQWGDELGQKITWLASSKQDQTAELHLNPPQLGPLDVVIKVSGDQATAQFTSPHAAVREAIEQAMPKLRDMLADNGIMLGNATVSDQTPRDQSQPESPRSPLAAEADSRTTPISGNSAARVSQISRHNGIVDTFA